MGVYLGYPFYKGQLLLLSSSSCIPAWFYSLKSSPWDGCQHSDMKYHFGLRPPLIILPLPTFLSLPWTMFLHLNLLWRCSSATCYFSYLPSPTSQSYFLLAACFGARPARVVFSLGLEHLASIELVATLYFSDSC